MKPDDRDRDENTTDDETGPDESNASEIGTPNNNRTDPKEDVNYTDEDSKE